MLVHRISCIGRLSCQLVRRVNRTVGGGISQVGRRRGSHCTRCFHSSRIVDVTDLAQILRRNVRSYTKENKRIRLMGILAHDKPLFEDAELYSKCIAETFDEDGIDYEVCQVRGNQPDDVAEAIRSGNSRLDVHGILVFYPIFKKREPSPRGPYKNQLTGVYYKSYDDSLRDLVLTRKDVEGLSHEYNAPWLFRARGMQPCHDDEVIYPCTARAVMRILEAYHPAPERDASLGTPSWRGTTVTIINRSEIMGRPLAAMLANAGAEVYAVDAHSILLFRNGGRIRRCTDPSMSLEWCLRQSSVVVSGVPEPEFRIPCEHINLGATVVNVSEYPNVCEEAILGIPGVKYIPQVGKVTIAVLEQNLISLRKQYP